MHKNYCSSCKYNFSTLYCFEKHLVGSYKIGRRCLTKIEMLEKNWKLKKCLVTFTFEGTNKKISTPTWILPVTEKEQNRLIVLRQKKSIH